MAYTPKSSKDLLNSGAPKDLVFSPHVFQQGETWVRLLPLDPTFATMGCCFPNFIYLHKPGGDGKKSRRLISYATWQKPCIIRAFLQMALKTGDAGIKKIVTEFINEGSLHLLKSDNQELGTIKELVINMVGLTLMPKIDKTADDEFIVPEEFGSAKNPFTCAVKQATIQDSILGLGSTKTALSLLKPKEGPAICIKRVGSNQFDTKYTMRLSDSPVPLAESYFSPQSADNPLGYPDAVGILLRQTQDPECVLNYLLNAFMGNEIHPIQKDLEALGFDPLSDEADDRINEVIASIKTSMLTPSFSISVPGGIADRLSMED